MVGLCIISGWSGGGWKYTRHVHCIVQDSGGDEPGREEQADVLQAQPGSGHERVDLEELRWSCGPLTSICNSKGD